MGGEELANDINKILIGAAVRKSLKKIKKSPEREIRNLVDLGLEFSSGGYQKDFLRKVSAALKKPNSAYYQLAKNVLNSVDTDILTVFGMNLGYNSCTKGVKKIRKNEAERGLFIPWALSLEVIGEKLCSGFYDGLLSKAVELGTYLYILSYEGNPSELVELIKNRPECAFIILVEGGNVSDEFVEKAADVKNAVIFVNLDENAGSACKKLRKAKLFYGVSLNSSEENKAELLSGETLENVIKFKASSFMLKGDNASGAETDDDAYNRIESVRQDGRYPLVAIDLERDIGTVDNAVSGGCRLLGFDKNGFALTCSGADERYNVFTMDFIEILKNISLTK